MYWLDKPVHQCTSAGMNQGCSLPDKTLLKEYLPPELFQHYPDSSSYKVCSALLVLALTFQYYPLTVECCPLQYSIAPYSPVFLIAAQYCPLNKAQYIPSQPSVALTAQYVWPLKAQYCPLQSSIIDHHSQLVPLTVQYCPSLCSLPLSVLPRTPQSQTRGNFWRQRGIFDRIYRVES